MHQTTIGTLNITSVIFFMLFVASTLAITWWAAKRTAHDEGFLRGGQEHHGFPERPCPRRRLHERRLVPRHRGPGGHPRL